MWWGAGAVADSWWPVLQVGTKRKKNGGETGDWESRLVGSGLAYNGD